MQPRLLVLPVLAGLLVAGAGAQTRITAPPNKYTPAQDVQMGLQAAADARKQLPILQDDGVTSYVQRLGERLTAVIPPEFQHAEFKYSFEAVNVREINAFALPGGPMFVNRGMIEASNAEGEVVGVMAHELSHVLLRHGTAQASKAGRYQAGQVAGAVLGAIIGGRMGAVVAQTTQFGLGAAFLRFGREYEKQADIMGAQLMARAGYDARDMAAMFRTIEKEGGANGPEWLSDHPNPGNRSDYIEQEARALHVANPVTDHSGFDRVKAHLKTLAPAPTSEEVAKARSATAGTSDGRDNPGPASGSLGRVEPPSSRVRDYTEGNLFRITVPSNWRELAGSSAVTFAPTGAFGRANGQDVFTHGVEVGLERSERHDLPDATDDFIRSLAQNNRRLERRSDTLVTVMAGRRALQTTLGNVSDATGQPEVIQLVTTRLRDGSLFYLIGVCPEAERRTYDGVFQQVIQSVRIND